MLEMLYTIPEELGWAIVGALGMLVIVMAAKLGSMFMDARKDDESEE